MKQQNLTEKDLIELFEQYKVTPNRVTTNEEEFIFYKEQFDEIKEKAKEILDKRKNKSLLYTFTKEQWEEFARYEGEVNIGKIEDVTDETTIWHNLHFETLAHTIIGSIIGIIVSYCMGLSLPNACFCTAIMVPASYARQYLVARFFGVMRRRCK